MELRINEMRQRWSPKTCLLHGCETITQRIEAVESNLSNFRKISSFSICRHVWKLGQSGSDIVIFAWLNHSEDAVWGWYAGFFHSIQTRRETRPSSLCLFQFSCKSLQSLDGIALVILWNDWYYFSVIACNDVMPKNSCDDWFYFLSVTYTQLLNIDIYFFFQPNSNRNK